jgi:uncharacterized membrane protein YcfT
VATADREDWLDRRQGLVLCLVVLMLTLVVAVSGEQARLDGQGGVFREFPVILVVAPISGLLGEVPAMAAIVLVNASAYYFLIRALTWLGSRIFHSEIR